MFELKEMLFAGGDFFSLSKMKTIFLVLLKDEDD